MGQPPHNRQFTKIFIQRHQDTRLSVCLRQNFSVTGIMLPCPRPDNIMSGLLDLQPRATPDTRVEQEFCHFRG